MRRTDFIRILVNSEEEQNAFVRLYDQVIIHLDPCKKL